jgi:hypothetical protein
MQYLGTFKMTISVTEYQEAIKYRFSMLQENFIDKLLEPYLRIKVRE